MNRISTSLMLGGAAALMAVSAPVFAGGCGKTGGHPMYGYGYHNGPGMAYYHHPNAMPMYGGGYRHGYGHKQGDKHGASAGSQATETSESLSDIVETAVAAGSFETLISAAKAAGLVNALKGNGPFTVFAPTDKAFATLPEGTVEELLGDAEQLKKVLTYHVVPGKLDSQAISSVTGMITVEGSELPVERLKLSVTDIEATNGIIHVIDEVLIPQS